MCVWGGGACEMSERHSGDRYSRAAPCTGLRETLTNDGALRCRAAVLPAEDSFLLSRNSAPVRRHRGPWLAFSKCHDARGQALPIL